MGLGKTLTAIGEYTEYGQLYYREERLTFTANFVDGRSAADSQGPTLIVVPRNLVTHWFALGPQKETLKN